MHKTVIIFMVLEVGRRGAAGSSEMHRAVIISMVLEVSGRGQLA